MLQGKGIEGRSANGKLAAGGDRVVKGVGKVRDGTRYAEALTGRVTTGVEKGRRRRGG